MMELWMLLLLLHLHLVSCVSLPAPLSVSISSFNMQHILSFLPGPGTPSDTHFTVEVVHLRKNSWRQVSGCLELLAEQTCNLTMVFKDPYDHYQARIKAFTSNQTSNWTLSGVFQPLSDTVLEPPDVTLSGCGNCLIVQLAVPARKLLQNLQLKELYKRVIFHVQRTRDGAQFTLNLPYNDKNEITYLQPGVEYCVTVSARGLFNSNYIPSKPYCAFTSPPSSKSSNALYVVFILLGVFCMLGFLFIGLVVYGSQLSSELITEHLPRSLLNTFIQGRQHRRAQLEFSGHFSASQLHGSANCLLMAHSPVQALKSSSEQGAGDCALALT
ncbi:interferon alpha/beta receptor 2-like isoform X2 [Anabas testudineus]|uniref:interferon alpha/beta receptor 2-like isoform X2 n=1 Tax=Anabas testudineus TaxID=64144 RepID=UPI000E45E8C1|nr:interferon alpha/beta receptor 2-like isoform X2 [Anabas testudineus]